MVPDQPVLPRHADAVGRPPGSEPDHAGTVRKSSPRERLESVIAAAGPGEDEAYVQALRDYQDLIYSELAPGGLPQTALGWPDGLDIPGDADHRPSWHYPPPDDDRYRRAYQGVTPGRGQGTADARTGRVTAYVNAGALAGRANAYGGVGAEIRPKAVLSYLTVTASQNLTVEHRFHFLTDHAFGGSSITEYDCVAGVGVAHVDPVTGAWEWLNPVRTRPFVRVTYTGLQGMPLSSRTYALDDLATTVQVQGGGTYVAATWVEATIVPQILDVGGRPYQKKPEDQVLLYAQPIGHAPTIRTATTVLV